MAGGKFGGGSGTAANPYIVEDGADFAAIVGGGHYIQSKDITVSSGLNITFVGSYNGAGHNVNGLTGPYGLFYEVTTNGSVTGVNIINPSLSGAYSAGGICNILQLGVISKCSVRGGSIANAGGYRRGCGGIVGKINGAGIISDCYTTCEIRAVEEGGGIAGTLVKNGTVKIINCYSTSRVYSGSIAGGIFGVNAGTGGVVGSADIDGCVALNEFIACTASNPSAGELSTFSDMGLCSGIVAGNTNLAVDIPFYTGRTW